MMILTTLSGFYCSASFSIVFSNFPLLSLLNALIQGRFQYE